MTIGVFDSGIGGEAIARSLAIEFSDADIMSVSDREHLPYGNRSVSEIQQLTTRAIQPLLAHSCDVIVIACNTATAAAIELLRKTYPEQLFIGLEPMVKPAVVLSRSMAIAICATPATLASERYQKAKQQFASSVKVIEPDCSDWAMLIEANRLNQSHIDEVVEECLQENVDVIVLGCTHYHWIKEEVTQATAGRATVLEPSEAIGRRVRQLLDS